MDPTRNRPLLPPPPAFGRTCSHVRDARMPCAVPSCPHGTRKRYIQVTNGERLMVLRRKLTERGWVWTLA